MSCIDGLGSSVIDYVISDTHVLNCIVKLNILNDHKHDYNHRPLSLTLKLGIHINQVQKNGEIQKHIHFNKSKNDLFLQDLKRNLGYLKYNDNIDLIYHDFTTTLSTTINKFSIEVSYKKNNKTLNLWYDNNYKIFWKAIRDAPSETAKLEKISTYKDFIKRKKQSYINKREEHLLHLSKIEPRNFWRNILVRKIK